MILLSWRRRRNIYSVRLVCPRNAICLPDQEGVKNNLRKSCSEEKEEIRNANRGE